MSEVSIHLDYDDGGWHVEDATFDGQPVDPRLLLRLLAHAKGMTPGGSFRDSMFPLDLA